MICIHDRTYEINLFLSNTYKEELLSNLKKRGACAIVPPRLGR